MARTSLHRKKTAVLCASLLLTAANADVVGGGSGPTGSIDEVSDVHKWEAAIASANATASFPMRGYDITKAYPSKLIDGWDISINVIADMPVDDGNFFTGTAFQIIAPKALVQNDTVKEDASWNTCVTVYETLSLSSQKDTVNSTCAGVVSEKCRKALDSYAGPTTCQHAPAIPSDCKNDLKTGQTGTFNIGFDSRNGSTVDIVYANDKARHNKGSTTSYDSAIRKIWLVSTNWEKRRENSTGRIADGDTMAGQFHCLRVNEFSQGSRTFHGAAGRGVTLSYSALMIAAFIPVFVALI